MSDGNIFPEKPLRFGSAGGVCGHGGNRKRGIAGENGDNLDRRVRWSSDWPDSEGYWWLHRAGRGHFPTTLVRAGKSGDGSLMVVSETEILYRQQQAYDWSFARAELPRPPDAGIDRTPSEGSN